MELPTTLLATAPTVAVSRTCVATAATTLVISPSTAPLRPEWRLERQRGASDTSEPMRGHALKRWPDAALGERLPRRPHLCYAVAVVPAGEFLALFCKLTVGDKWTRCLSEIFLNVLLWWVVIIIHGQNLWHVVTVADLVL